MCFFLVVSFYGLLGVRSADEFIVCYLVKTVCVRKICNFNGQMCLRHVFTYNGPSSILHHMPCHLRTVIAVSVSGGRVAEFWAKHTYSRTFCHPHAKENSQPGNLLTIPFKITYCSNYRWNGQIKIRTLLNTKVLEAIHVTECRSLVNMK